MATANKNVKKAIGLDKQNNNFAHAYRFFVLFQAAISWGNKQNITH